MVIIRGRTFAERAPSCRLVEQDMTNRLTWIAAIGAAALTACQEPAPPRPEARPVRTVTVERRAGGEPLVLAGQIRAQDEASLAFRLDGRMIERRANVRDRLKAGQLAARLNLQNQQNALRSAQANLSAAQGQLTQARNTLIGSKRSSSGASRSAPSSTRRSRRSRPPRRRSSPPRPSCATQDQLSYTELHADATRDGQGPSRLTSAVSRLKR